MSAPGVVAPSGRPRVLLVHYTFPSVTGGVELVLARHATALRERAEVRILAGRGAVGADGIEAIRVPLVDSRNREVVAAAADLAAGRVPATFEPLRARLRETLLPHLAWADRVVLHNVVTMPYNLPLVAALHDLAPSLPAGRTIVWVHDLAAADAFHTGSLHPGAPWELLRQPLAGARYVAVSEERRAALAASLGLPPDAIQVVPNGIDVDAALRISPATRALAVRAGIEDAHPFVLLPARLVRRKRIEAAIDAAAELRRRGWAARLIVTGAPDPHDPAAGRYLGELRECVARAGGRDVLLHDLLRRSLPRRTVDDLYGLADVVVLPSATEGFGLPIAEAAIKRVPIVCSDLPPLRAVAGDAATYVPPDADGATIATAIERALAADPAGRLASRIRAKFDWRRILERQVIPTILG